MWIINENPISCWLISGACEQTVLLSAMKLSVGGLELKQQSCPIKPESEGVGLAHWLEQMTYVP